MVKRLTKHGNSLALVIDKPILDLLGITADTPLSVTTNGRQLVIAAAGDAEHKAKVREGYEAVKKRYGAMLRRLADK